MGVSHAAVGLSLHAAVRNRCVRKTLKEGGGAWPRVNRILNSLSNKDWRTEPCITFGTAVTAESVPVHIDPPAGEREELGRRGHFFF